MRPRQNTLARVLVISCGQKPEAAAVPRPSRPRVSVCNTGVSSLRSAGGGAAHVITPESGRPVADLVLFCGPPDPSQPSSVFDAVLPLDLQRKIDFVESVRELGGGEAFLAVPFGNVWLAQNLGNHLMSWGRVLLLSTLTWAMARRSRLRICRAAMGCPHGETSMREPVWPTLAASVPVVDGGQSWRFAFCFSTTNGRARR